MSLKSNILGAAIFIITALYVYFKFFVFTFWRKKGVYTMKPTFPIGNMMPLLTGKMSYGEFFKYVYEKNKKHRLVGVYMLSKPYLMVNDPDLVRNILVNEFTNFHDRGVFCNPDTDPLSGNLFQMNGSKWRHLRVKLTPTFTSGKIKQIFPILKDTGDVLAKYFNRKAELKESIDVKEILTRYSIDVIMSAAFGITCDSINNPDDEFHFWGKEITAPRLLANGLVAFAPQVFDYFSMPYTKRGVEKFFTTVFRDTVKYRESHDIVRKDFLNLLMQLMKNGYVDPDEDSTKRKTDANIVENKLTLVEATAQAFAFYVAGFETSSATVTFCLYELAKHQDIQDELRNEIRNAIEKHGDITYNSLSDMPYLHKVISETMRKYPALVLLNRICTKETTLESTNVTIPKGTSVMIPVYGFHWDPNIFPEPEKFDPERFSEENIKSRHPYVYLPFGEGPRICIGLRFGLVQMKVAVINALINHRFKFTTDTPDSLELMSGSLVLVAKGGVHLSIEKLT